MPPRSSKKAADAAPETPAEPIDFSEMTLLQRLAQARVLVGGHVEKGGRNEKQEYDFVTQADVARKVGGALAAVGVAVIPSYTLLDTKPYTNRAGGTMFLVTISATFRFFRVEDKVKPGSITHPMSEFESVVIETVGQGSDSGDKAPYKAMTGAAKYAMLHALTLATGDDPEEARSEPAAPAAPAAPTPAAPAEQAATTETQTTPVGGDPKAQISTAQLRLIFARSTDAGLDTNQFKALVFNLTGQRDSRRLTSGDVDTILEGLKDEQQVARVKQPGADAAVQAAELLEGIRERTGGEVVAAPAGEDAPF